MPSLIAKIGDGLSTDHFQTFVLPNLSYHCLVVNDWVPVPGSSGETMLAALGTGLARDVRLEEALNAALLDSGYQLELVNEHLRRYENTQEYFRVHSVQGNIHQRGMSIEDQVTVGKFEVVSSYSANDTASQLFSAQALPYLMQHAQASARRVEEQIKGLLGKRIGDLR